jgi:hypothetical protein
MAQSEEATASAGTELYREYVADVRIVELDAGEKSRYRFEAPEHVGIEFSDAEMAALYADVYFDVNGFREEGTGEIGVPPELVQAGKDTLAAYLLTQPHTTVDWIASFYGKKPGQIERYIDWVRERAEEMRAEARRQNVA